MLATVLTTLLAAPSLEAVYLACLIIGGGLLLISAAGALGHQDVDMGGADVDADVGGADLGADAGGAEIDTDAGGCFDAAGAHDVATGDVHTDFGIDAHAGNLNVIHADHMGHGGILSVSTWFSLRMVVFAAASFGAIGLIMSKVGGATPGVALAFAIIGGLVVGQAVHQLFRYVRMTSGDTSPRPEDYVRKLARVSIPVEHPYKGEVTLIVRGGRRCVPAVTPVAGGRFAAGEEVVVISYAGGVAQVVSREEFERRFRAESGQTRS